MQGGGQSQRTTAVVVGKRVPLSRCRGEKKKEPRLFGTVGRRGGGGTEILCAVLGEGGGGFKGNRTTARKKNGR